MSFWLVDRYLPGLAVSATWMPFWTLALWLLHRNLKRHITRTTDRQTATLTGSAPETTGGAPMSTPVPDPGQPAPHRHVPHPRDLLAGPGGELRKANDWAAFRLAAIYGAAITIWLFALYTFTGAIFTAQQPTLLYWSNGAQLVFCPLMVYVGNRLGKGQQAKADADHEALGHIANTVDKILGSVGAGKDAAQ